MTTATTYHGQFWERPFESNVLIPELEANYPVNTPIRWAFMDACIEIEESVVDLAIVKINLDSDGVFSFEATSRFDPTKKYITRTCKCLKCNVVIYYNYEHRMIHPYNGCELVLIEEIMLA